jgi:glucokinase
MGPGTGFGLALLVHHRGGCTIVSAEGGHIAFVPHGELETKVWAALQENLGRVTVETLLSGVGLMRIYRELCHIHGQTPLNYDARTISNQALDHGDEICLETLSVFCSMLGSVAGDVSLSHGSTGGVFLAGGILPKIKDFFLKSNFVERFLEKPPMEEFVGNIPVHMITAPDAALKGAALLYLEKTEHCSSAA